MDFSELSDEAKAVAKLMIAHCISNGLCMGMDEGIESFNPNVKRNFRKEL
ncbi:hypothetical protein [Idiomarina abyssalis]|uniref:Uncharacterized protein n=1 Tax=Idiomarina abyssalis TaxID=86102 RepID=A0A8I1KI89_9GAMM|nr:hypothetical protein [Idiomarina abyssalis]MBJ7265554.1 hypothetical protein [Idiomarina abyssalis]MBJ7316772.1 hypothetical protein [Idiomarina abyssalis]